jgi:hypothetical protein
MLAIERKDLEDVWFRLLAHELAAKMRENGLNSKVAKLAEKEKQVAER